MSFNYTDLLLEAGNLLGKAKTKINVSEILIEYVNSGLQPDLSCFYIKEKSKNQIKLIIKRGFPKVPEIFQNKSELFGFLFESKEVVCLNTRKESPFQEILLNESMNSGIAAAIFLNDKEFGVLIVNSLQTFNFKKKELYFLENLVSLVINQDMITRS